MVHLRCAMQLTETSEEFADVLLCDSSASIANFHLEALVTFYVSLFDLNNAFLCELNRIFDQVDEHLFVPSFVANEQDWLHRACCLCRNSVIVVILLNYVCTFIIFCGKVFYVFSADLNAFSLRSRRKHIQDEVDDILLIERFHDQ